MQKHVKYVTVINLCDSPSIRAREKQKTTTSERCVRNEREGEKEKKLKYLLKYVHCIVLNGNTVCTVEIYNLYPLGMRIRNIYKLNLKPSNRRAIAFLYQ